MAKVAIIMGSKSDEKIMENAHEYLSFFGIEFDTFIMSAHRTPDQTAEFAKNARKNGYAFIIAGAGMAAHLPGVIASHTTVPVIGVPLGGSELNGVDALYSIVQMPRGVPVATMAIGKSGAVNAAVYAAQILAGSDKDIQEKLTKFRNNGCKL